MASIIADWRIDFMRAHPRLFEVMADEPHLSFGCPRCEEGWRDILQRLCIRIESALREDEKFELIRVKQKFGLLRVGWYDEVSDETRMRIHEAVNLATARSACTCKICGAKGRLYSNRGCLATRCAEHASGDPLRVEAGRENVGHYHRTRGKPDMFYARYDRETDMLTEVPPARRTEQ